MVEDRTQNKARGDKNTAAIDWYTDPFRVMDRVCAFLRTGKVSSAKARATERDRHEDTRRGDIKSKAKEHELEQAPLYLAIFGYVSYVFLFVVGYLRELIWGLGPLGTAKPITETNRDDYTPLYASFESFYTRNVYRRLKDVFNRPIASVPGATVKLVNRYSEDHFWTWKMAEAQEKEYINLASYNYLGFAENTGRCTENAIAEVFQSSLAVSSSRHEIGTMRIHQELERTVAEFMGVDDAITVGMGFATNTLNLPLLVSKDCLVLSDEKNHASLILGLRLSGATVMVFKHNNVEHLERILRKAIIHGHPKTRRPWKKIVIVVEGVYSMEGTICRLPEMVNLKRKYGAYIYLDEAHSTGAMGPNGRGVVDYFGINPKEIDILMGTFTKSFGSAGGYIAGNKNLISFLRVNSQGFAYATAMSPPVAQQIISSMKEIMDKENGDGMRRVRQLASNIKYFRGKLRELGCVIYGHEDSPVVPLMLFVPAKIPALVNGLLEFNVASIGVGFPATKMTEERARYCISAGHTKEHLDKAIEAIDKCADRLCLKYNKAKMARHV